MRRRNKLEICMDVLKGVCEGVDTPTKLMYRTNLTSKVLGETLRGMVVANMIMISQVGRRKTYRLTPEGQVVYNELWHAITALSPALDPIAEWKKTNEILAA